MKSGGHSRGDFVTTSDDSDQRDLGLSRSLLSWFDAQQRTLPWRASRDPYHVWVSEIMLQQTQVQTVIGYYEAFMEQFPTVERLAAAPLERVLAMWSGLGYYRRARSMHAAARQIVASGVGFPSSSSEMLELPGIGPYTAAAIASIAFGEVVPVMDGNVERVLCRRLGLEEDPKMTATRQRLLDAARRLLDSKRPGDSNQALMEVGATTCRPRRPECQVCPLQEGCRARLDGDPYRYPRPRRRRRVERIDLTVAVVHRKGAILLFQRPRASRVLAGMWELPNVEHRDAISEVESALARRFGGRWELDEEIGQARHGITYRAYTLHIHLARLSSGGLAGEGPEAAWVAANDRARFPTSSMVEKVLSQSSL